MEFDDYKWDRKGDGAYQLSDIVYLQDRGLRILLKLTREVLLHIYTSLST